VVADRQSPIIPNRQSAIDNKSSISNPQSTML
jgi:hypothetical protein